MTFDPLQQSGIPIYAFTTALTNTRIYRIVTFLQTSLRFIFQNLELFYGFNKLYSQLPDIV